MLLYVTKWVLARGILLVEGSPPHKRGQSHNLYSDVRGVGRSTTVVMIGSEAFFTLKEAREDAQQRFKVRLKRAQTELRTAQHYWKQLEAGVPLAVHKKPILVSKCGPFDSKKKL